MAVLVTAMTVLMAGDASVSKYTMHEPLQIAG